MLGTKIKTLRTRKQLSQTALAQLLSVSPQTVSKWENHVSSPDISILTHIAGVLEVSMDELFDYKPQERQYKDRFVRFLYENGILQFGSFVLKSGRSSPYRICSGQNHQTKILSQLASFYASCLMEHALERSCLFGVTNSDVSLVIATAIALCQGYSVDARYCSDIELLSQSDCQTELTLLTDTYTSGKTLQDSIECVYARLGRYPKNVIVSVDRMEQSEHPYYAAKTKLKEKYGVDIHAIVCFDDIIRSVERNVINCQEYLPFLYRYKKEYYEHH